MTVPVTGNPYFSGLLIHEAKVYRRQKETAPGTEIPAHVDAFGQREKIDSFGQPTQDEQYSHTLQVRFSTPKGGRRFEERSRDVIKVTGRLFLDLHSDLREQDRVTVTNAEGTILVEDAIVDELEVVHDGIGEHHREATLISQREVR